MDRTTLTLDDDVASKLREAMRRSGQSFKETVNSLLRRALVTQEREIDLPRFRVQPRAMGLRPGFDHDRISSLIEDLDGPDHR
jgi:hypothetical protein